MEQSNWRVRAKCRGIEDPDGFFFTLREREQPENWVRVRRVEDCCRACTVVAECREDTRKTDVGLRGGIWRDRSPKGKRPMIVTAINMTLRSAA